MVFEGVPPSSDQQYLGHGIVFSPRRSRHSTISIQEIDLEAAGDDRNSASQEQVDVVGLDEAESGNSKESITQKAEV